MTILKLINVDSENINYASEYFDDEYLSDLKSLKPNSYNESLVARYIVSKITDEEFDIDNFVPKIDFDEEEEEVGLYYSISHKQWLIFIWVSEKPIWVDIELITNRDVSVFEYFTNNEWNVLGEKNFDNFYLGWTAKESLLKYLELWIDNINNIDILRIIIESNKFWDVEFNKIIVLNYDWNYFKAYSWKNIKKLMFYSVVI